MKTRSPVPARNLVLVLLFTFLVSSLIPSCRARKEAIAEGTIIRVYLADVVSAAERYRRRPSENGGGGGTYIGFTIPCDSSVLVHMLANTYATFTPEVSAQRVKVTAVSKERGANKVIVEVDSSGNSWGFLGEFEQ
jgi:hypothetical protein